MYERYVLKLHLHYDAKLDREDRIKELRTMYHEERAQYEKSDKDTESAIQSSELPEDVIEYFHYESGGIPSSQLPSGMLTSNVRSGGALH